MRVLDLFSGIGGFSLGLERAGMRTVAFCEIEPYCRAVLRKHWPDVPCYEDVRELTADRLARDGITDIDLVCGGVPCQPASVAGSRRGRDDERWLWPAFIQVVRASRPAWVLAENPLGIVSLKPHGLEWICGALRDAGYDVWPVVISAYDVGAPHLRKRVWIIARAADALRGELRNESWRRDGASGPGATKLGDDGPQESLAHADAGRRQVERESEHGAEQGALRREPDGCGEGRSGARTDLADTDQSRLEGWDSGELQERAGELFAREGSASGLGQPWLVEPSILRVVNGVSDWLDRLDLTPCLEAISSYASQAEVDPAEAVRMVRKAHGEAEIFQWKARSADHVCAPQILLPLLRRLETRCKTERADEARETHAARPLRIVSDHKTSSGSPHRSESQQQFTGEHSDSLQELSRLLAQYGAVAWEKDRGSYAADRVSRLKALGNAVVPAIPEIIGRAIMGNEL